MALLFIRVTKENLNVDQLGLKQKTNATSVRDKNTFYSKDFYLIFDIESIVFRGML